MVIQLANIEELYSLPSKVRWGVYNMDNSALRESVEVMIGDFAVPVSMVVEWQSADTPDYCGWSEGASFSLSFTGESFKHYGETSYRDSIDDPDGSETFSDFLEWIDDVVLAWVNKYAQALDDGTEKIEQKG